MATRIEIELTSRRDDATFTWRAAGAREPKGVADVSLFPADSDVGSLFRVDAEVELDGITILAVLPPKAPKKQKAETLQLLAREDEPLVTQQLAPKTRRDNDRKGRGRGGDRKGRGDGKRGDSKGRGGDRPRTPPKPKLPPKPKPPRLKAGRVHRDAVVAELPEEQKPVAQEVIKGGLQAVRQAVATQNTQLEAEGKPQIDESRMVALAEQLLVKVRAAEWQDRAEAALDQAETVDVRDLRSVVTAADGAAKGDETRALAAKLREALSARLDADHQAWIDEIIELLDDDRVVRALHLSSRPPKAGAPLPAPVAMRLVEAANAAMTSDVSAERWGYMLDALAHSPVRRQVVPASLPSKVSPELETAIKRHGSRLPEIAEIFGVEVDKPRKRPRKRKPPKPENSAKPDDAPAPPEAADSSASTDVAPESAATPSETPAPDAGTAATSPDATADDATADDATADDATADETAV
ncbi:MAG: hypothetical protein OSA99_14790 [Acidimicrobiales bacterium]|nr:hypothetical protein [Acidimicrobiales bacterium]